MLFSEYKITDRRMRRAYHGAQYLSLVPIGIVILLMVAGGATRVMGLWTALGSVLGAQLVLSGAYRLHMTPDRLSPLGQRISDRSSDWFPFLLFLVQNISVITVLLVLWFSVQRLGFPASGWQDVNLICLILLVPTRMIVLELGRLKSSARYMALGEILGYPVTILATLLLAPMVAGAFAASAAASGDTPPPVTVIWVVAVLIVVSCLSMMLHRSLVTMRGGKKTG